MIVVLELKSVNAEISHADRVAWRGRVRIFIGNDERRIFLKSSLRLQTEPKRSKKNDKCRKNDELTRRPARASLVIRH